MSDVEDRSEELLLAIRGDVPRQFVVDVAEKFAVAANQAKTSVMVPPDDVEAIKLSSGRGHKAVGLVRHQIFDEAFEQIAVKNGAELKGVIVVPATDGKSSEKRLFITVAEFGNTLIGFASHRERADLPSGNQSRRVLCAMNEGLGPDLLDSREDFGKRQRFAVIMVQRDLADVGKIASMTLAVVDRAIRNYLAQVDIKDFLAGYGAKPSAGTSVKLKGDVVPFRKRGEENPERDKGGK